MKLLFFILLFPFAASAQIFFNANSGAQASVTITYDTVDLRYTNSTSTSAAPINNVVVATSTTIVNPVFRSGAASTITVSLSSYNSVATNASTCTDPTPTGFPNAVFFRNVLSTSTNMVLTITGVPTGKKMDVIYQANRNGITANATVTSQSQSATITDINNNCNNTAILTNLVESGGTITGGVTVSSTGTRVLQIVRLVFHN